ncbi:putative nucleoside protein [Botrytis fragariae]|uniref:Putative nucleoside protein n=1 Tax=Botrytis fragariae TaxID=1964551 RepID=A0A8H6EMZ5_9HELO|nr:putative nucleoside protein [Botrytis fragariae]KAF5878069.1 putative nucleoside protein [Botrytis fragariae]
MLRVLKISSLTPFRTNNSQVTCQISHFAAARNPRYFTDPLEYRPQRWLPSKHPKYEDKHQNDDPKAFLPFNQEPRMCSASAIAWTQMKLYLAKVLWTCDIEAGPGQELSFDRGFSVCTMWNKLQFWVGFVPVKSKEGR